MHFPRPAVDPNPTFCGLFAAMAAQVHALFTASQVRPCAALFLHRLVGRKPTVPGYSQRP